MNRFIDVFARLITYVIYLVRALEKGEQPPFQKISNENIQLIEEMEKRLDDLQSASDDYINARFAVFAWIDEMVMNSNWQEKHLWLKDTLQRRYYQTSDAGELFFERLNQIGIHQNQVREVYLVCLSLGFEGRYCNPGDTFLLEQLKKSNLRVLTGSSLGIPTMDQANIFPEAGHANFDERAVGQKNQRNILSTLVIGFLPVAVFITLFMVYSFILESAGREIMGLMVQ